MRDDVQAIIDGLLDSERMIVQLKTAQGLGGRAIRNYKTSTEAPYDYAFRILQTAGTRRFKITFNHSRVKSGALLRLKIFCRVDNPNVMQDPIPHRTPTAPALHTRWFKVMPPSGDKTVWIVNVIKGQFGIAYYDAYFKFFIDGTDEGSWTIESL